MKKCKNCDKIKDINEFHVCNGNKDGRNNTCKECRREIEKQRREDNPERYREIINRYVSSDKGQQTRKKVRREYYLNNKEVENKRSNEWNKANREKIREYERNHYGPLRRERDKHEIMWRTLLNNTLKRLDKPKEGHTIDLLGYSALELKEHLESKFTDGMSWDNYGEWHIDHIIPVNTFDVDTNPNVVNALNNLRPLWATTREINGIVYEGNLNRNKI